MHLPRKVLEFDFFEYLHRRYKNVSPDDKKIFLWSIFLGFLAHGASLTDLYVNEDGHEALHNPQFFQWRLGRWLSEPLYSITETYPFQFLHVLLLILLLSLAATLLSKIIKIQSILLRVLCSGVLVTYPAFAVGISYNFVILVFAVACFFSVLSVRVASKGGLNIVTGATILMLSLSLYQGFFALSLSLCVAHIITIYLELDFSKKNQIILFLRKCFEFTSFTILASIFYILSLKICEWYFDQKMYEYKGANNIGSIDLTWHSLQKVFIEFTGYFQGLHMKMPLYTAIPLVGILLISILPMMVTNIPKSREYWLLIFKTGGLFVLFIILIITSMIYPIIAPSAPVGVMQTYGLIPIFALAISQLHHFRGIIKNICIFFIFLVVLGFINRSNALHLQSHLYTKSTFLTANRLLSRIESLPEFSKDSKIAILGRLPNEVYKRLGTPPFDEKTQGWWGGPVGFKHTDRAYKFTNVIKFLDYKLTPEPGVWLDYKLNPAEIRERTFRIKKLASDMPQYPAPGSVKAFGKLIIVKLGDI